MADDDIRQAAVWDDLDLTLARDEHDVRGMAYGKSASHCPDCAKVIREHRAAERMANCDHRERVDIRMLSDPRPVVEMCVACGKHFEQT